MRYRQYAFTIVELLIVIVVIGILATITIVAFNGVTRDAAAAALKSDLKQASTTLELHKIDNSTYPTTEQAALALLTPSPTHTFEYTFTPPNSFCLSIINPTADNLPGFHISNTNLEPTEGVCVGHTGPGGGEDELGGFTSVSFGYEHACGISSSLAFCWGKGGGGMLGNASTEDSSAPVAVDTSGVLAGKTITDISAGRNRTCAVADGQAYCWGLNGSVGALGNNSTVDSLVPVAVDTTGALQGKTVTKISAGQSHTCAIADGKAYCWGINNSGHLGDGTSTHRLAPVAVNTSGVLADKTVTDIAAGWNFTCAVADSNAYCWGYNYAGDLGGGGGRYNNHYSPIAVHTGAFSGKQVTDISVGLYHACLLADGAPYCWGNGSYGVGNGGDSRYYTPVATSMSGVLANKTVTAISAGYNNTCVIADNQAYCWGTNNKGQLGDGSITNALVPITVETSGLLSGKTIDSISVGMNYTCATAAGQAYCWGYNNFGQLGNNSLVDSLVPVQVEAVPQ